LVVLKTTILYSWWNKATLLFCQWRVPFGKDARQTPLTSWFFFFF